MITNNSNNNYVFLNVFMFRIMIMTLMNINPHKEIFHHYDFPVYTTSKYRDPKLDTYRRITQKRPNLHVTTTFSLKQGETRTSSGPISHPLIFLENVRTYIVAFAKRLTKHFRYEN